MTLARRFALLVIFTSALLVIGTDGGAHEISTVSLIATFVSIIVFAFAAFGGRK